MRHPRPTFTQMLAICLALPLAACQENALKHLDPASEAPDPELGVSPEVLDFGQAGEGAVVTQTFTLSSFGDTAVHLADVAVQGGSSFSLTSPGGITIEPGDEVDVVVSWTPLTYDDTAQVRIESDALTPQLAVDLLGEGLYPGIEVDPGSMSFQSGYGEEDRQDLTVRSVGTTDLVVSQTLLTGASFGIDLGATGGALTLAPGESATFPVTYTPPGEDDTSTGNVWFSTNTADPSIAVPLFGETGVPCYGLGEAWDRGVLDALSSFTYQLALYDTDTTTPICMDQWYMFLSDTSQDAIAGDPYFDLSDDYPFGSVTIDPGSDVTFGYGERHDDAWWCMEHEQYTARGAEYEFLGARAPEKLRDLALAGDQDGIWARQGSQPVIAVGRTVNYVELGAGESGAGGIRVLNIGGAGSAVTVTETLPPGFAASDFSLAPESESTSSDGGAVYSWTVVLDRRQVDGNGGDTTYDEERITWTLTRTGACQSRLTAPETTALWADSDGTEISTANPLIILCR